MNISAPFVRRPIATVLLTAAIFLAGIVAFLQLPTAPLPQVDFPTINVQATLPGASPDIMASAVAAPLEREFAHIAGLNEMTSASYLGSDKHRVAIRFEPQHRRRSTRCAGGDQRRAREFAIEPAAEPDLSKGGSGRRADSHPRAYFQHLQPWSGA